jgi:hypothetical protein
MQDCLLRPTKEAMARGARLALFHDWEAMTGYDSNVRQNLTAWSLEHRTQIASINILVRSKIVAMRCNSRPRAEPWRNAIAFLLGPR